MLPARHPGEKACANNMNVSLENLDRPVIEELLKLLSVETIEGAIDDAVARYQDEGADIEAEKARLVAEVEKVKAERERLTRQVTKGNVSEEVADPNFAEIKERLRVLTAKVEHYDGLALAPKLGRAALREKITARLADWRDRLRKEPTIARQIIARLVDGWIKTDGKTFSGTASFGRILQGVVLDGSKGVARPADTSPQDSLRRQSRRSNAEQFERVASSPAPTPR